MVWTPFITFQATQKIPIPFLLFEGVSENCIQGQFLCTTVTASLPQGLNNHSCPVRGVLITQLLSPELWEERDAHLGLEEQHWSCKSPLGAAVAKYGLSYNGQHSTRNQHRKEEKSMVFLTQNSPSIGKKSSLTSKISKIPLTPMSSG